MAVADKLVGTEGVTVSDDGGDEAELFIVIATLDDVVVLLEVSVAIAVRVWEPLLALLALS